MNFKKHFAGVSASVLLMGSLAAVGGVAAVATATQAQAAGTISVTCLNWYDSNKNKWHVVAHVKDGNGAPVLGAKVFFENSVDPAGPAAPYVYQVSSSTTYNSATGGAGGGTSCGTRKSTSVTSDQCQPAGSPPGVYTSRITDVIPPTGSGLVWDGITPANSYTRATP